MRETFGKWQGGVAGGPTTGNLRYADGTVVLATMKEVLWKIVKRLKPLE